MANPPGVVCPKGPGSGNLMMRQRELLPNCG